MQPKRLLFLIILLTLVAAYIGLPATFPIRFGLGSWQVQETFTKPVINQTLFGKQIYREYPLKLGLDLQGGTQVILRAEMESIAEEDRESALESAKEVISRRVDMYGVVEPVVQTSKTADEYRIIVELPGVSDVNEALDLIGRTAQLGFYELPAESTEAAMLDDFVQTELTGKHLRRSSVIFGQTGLPEVGLEFNDEGKQLFSDITQRNVGKPVGIFLDGMPITIPQVNQHITDGNAVISGQFTLDEAKAMSIQLNAGALPVPIQILEQKNIGATLGRESVEKSIQAGFIGLEMVMLFMILYYGWPGFLASVGLIIYAIITLALYKLIPVTITLPSLTGFILSIGMAVDANILVF